MVKYTLPYIETKGLLMLKTGPHHHAFLCKNMLYLYTNIYRVSHLKNFIMYNFYFNEISDKVFKS